MEQIFQNAIEYGQKKGADQLDLYILEGCSETVQIEKNNIIVSESKSITGIGIRVYTNNSLGMATTSLLTKQAILEAINRAYGLSKASPSDELFDSLPGPYSDYPIIGGLADAETCSLPGDYLTEIAIEAIETALEKHDDIILSGNFKRTYATEKIINNLGISVEQNFSSLSGLLFAKALKNGEVATSWDYQRVRNVKDFSYREIAKNAVENAKSLLGAKKIQSEKLPLILDQRSTIDTIGSILSRGLNAYQVVLGTAFFKDSLGDLIATEQLTVQDNSLYPKGTGSSPFDDEGVPHQKLTLIEDGVAKAYFSDSYSAKILGIENTAHAERGGIGGKPHPGLNQLQIEAGDWTIDEMIAETKKGLYLKDSGLNPSSGTPNISNLIDQGYLIQDGELSHPIKETMVGTTVFHLLKNIEAISKERINESGSISPAIKVSAVPIAGGK
ncbi:MAG: TldD/PmbA family protein [Asgard group archaeon]|nr:TldD/PmbA family protein [Asgard group archaeon]